MDFLRPFGTAASLPICHNRRAVDAAVARAEDEGADLLVLVLLSYTPSPVALPALSRTHLPVLLLNTTPRADMGPGIAASDYLETHAIHGVQDLANVLLRAGKRPWIVSGHLGDPTVGAKAEAHGAAAAAISLWRSLRVGRVGATFPDMGDLFFDATALLCSGPSVVDIAPEEFAAAWESAPRTGGRNSRRQVPSALRHGPRRGAMPLRQSTRRVRCSGHRLPSQTRRARLLLPHLRASAIVMPFVGVSRLMAEGVGYGEEADALGAAGVAVLHRLTGCAGFTEMFCPDWKTGEVLMGHMGEANPQFARTRPIVLEKPSLLESDSASGVLLFESEPGPATLASLTTSPAGGLRWVVSEGDIASSPLYPALNAPNYKFKPHQPLPDFLTAYSEAGGSHHLALCRRHAALLIERLAYAIGVECRSV